MRASKALMSASPLGALSLEGLREALESRELFEMVLVTLVVVVVMVEDDFGEPGPSMRPDMRFSSASMSAGPFSRLARDSARNRASSCTTQQSV